MNWLRRHPVFAGVVLFSGAAVGAGSWWIWKAGENVSAKEGLLRQRVEERARLARQSPALSQENEEALLADLALAGRRAEELRRSLAGHERGFPSAPERTTDAFFALAAFVERSRALAARQQVTVRPGERFGFASHVQAGPAVELLPSIHRQRVVLEQVVELLVGARPDALLAVQRERPTPSRMSGELSDSGPGRSDSGKEVSTDAASDFFEPEGLLRLRVAGVATSHAFRVEFVGQTQTLRVFLNALAASALPLFVRSVEVEPASAEQSLAMASVGDPEPIVAQNRSKFAVVIELVELISAPAPATP